MSPDTLCQKAITISSDYKINFISLYLYKFQINLVATFQNKT